MRLPDPGRKRRLHLDDLLRETPGLAVRVDTYEQRVQRHEEREEADRWSSGKKKAHTVKTQVAEPSGTDGSWIFPPVCGDRPQISWC